MSPPSIAGTRIEQVALVKKQLTRMLAELEAQAERRRLRQRDLSAATAIHLVTYRSFGTRDIAYVAGRLLAGLAAPPAIERATRWRNLADVARSFNTHEIPNVKLEASWRDRIVPATTDEEGYFRAVIPLHGESADASSIEVTVRVVDPRVGERHIEGRAEVIIPPSSTEVLVVSDLDDTVIETNVRARLRMMRTVLLRNARSRVATPGMQSFIAALHRGSDGTRANPLFYVSGGPWNLYTVYRDFLDLQQFPRGAIVLADFGIDAETFIHPTHEAHKGERIKQIIDTYPALPIVFVGDSGEHDPEIYADFAARHPGRVRAVYIRDAADAGDVARWVPLEKRVSESGSVLVRFSNGAEALRDGRQRGLAH